MFDVNEARQEGYSDSEIANYLAAKKKFNLQGAKQEGYSDTEISEYLSQDKGMQTTEILKDKEVAMAYQEAIAAKGGANIDYQPRQFIDKNLGATTQPEQPPPSKYEGEPISNLNPITPFIGYGEAAGSIATGMSEFAVDTGIAAGAGYGTLVRGGTIDEAAKNITDMQEFVRPYVHYQPQTEEGKKAVENAGKALNWLIGKPSEIAGGKTQKTVEAVGLGETAGAVAGAGIQTLLELAGYMALFGLAGKGFKKAAGIKEPIKIKPPTDKDVIDFNNFIKEEAARLKGKKLKLDDVLEALRGRPASKEAYDYIKILPGEERSQLAKSILKGKEVKITPAPSQPESFAANRGIALQPDGAREIKPTGFDETVKINKIDVKEAGNMMAKGKPEVVEHIKEGIESGKFTPEEMQHVINNQAMLEAAKSPKGEARQKVNENINKVMPEISKVIDKEIPIKSVKPQEPSLEELTTLKKQHESIFAERPAKDINEKIVRQQTIRQIDEAIKLKLEAAKPKEAWEMTLKEPVAPTQEKLNITKKLRTSEEIQKVIDDLEDKYTKQGIDVFKTYDDTQYKATDLPPDYKPMPKDLVNLYRERELVDRKDAINFINKVSEDSGLSKEDVKNGLNAIQIGEDKPIHFIKTALDDWGIYTPSGENTISKIYNSLKSKDYPFIEVIVGGTADNPQMVIKSLEGKLQLDNTALTKTESIYNAIATNTGKDAISLRKFLTTETPIQGEKKLLPNIPPDLTVETTAIMEKTDKRIKVKENAREAIKNVDEKVNQAKNMLSDLEGKRVKLKDSPQDYTVLEEKPFDPKTDIEGERYVDIKNNKTGKIEKNIPIEEIKMIKVKEGKVEAGSLAFGQKLPKYAGNVNLERIDSSYAIKKTILDIADQYKGQINEAGRGKISLEETRNIANELGMTEKDLLKRRKGKAFNAEEGLAARDILNASATRLRQVQEEAVKLGTDEALLTFKLAIEQHAAIQAEVTGMTAEAGRALSSFRIKSQAMQQVKNYKAMLDALGGREMTEDILKKFAQIDSTNIPAINKFIRNVSKAKTTDMIFEAWVNSLLSGPQTHIVNTVSNLTTFLFKPIESIVSAGIEGGKQIITGKPRERFFGEAKHEIIGSLEGIKEGARVALKAYTTEIPSDLISKIETTKYQAIPSKTFKVKGKEYEVGGKQIRIPSRLLLAADEFSKAIVYRAELNSQAYRIASMERLRGKERLNRKVELINNPTDTMMQKAHEEAQYRTFTQPLGKMGNQLMSLRNHVPGLRYIIPFLRTPTNIAKFGLERTPLNFARLAYKRGIGSIKGVELSDELAKPIIGSLISSAVVVLIAEGKITGGGSKDKTERETLYRTGWQPYSLKIGDRYYGYNRIEPLGSILGMTADFTELTTDKDREEIAGKIALAFSKNLTSKTFMKGISDTLDAISDPDRYGEQWINKFMGSVVPSLSANITRAVDEKLRIVETPLDTIKSRIPVVSESLLPKRDLFGREILKTGNIATRLLSPIGVSMESTDKVDKEMVRLMGIGDFKINMPNKKIMGIELSNEEYDKYVKIAGERAKKILDIQVNNSNWDKKSDEIKAQIIKKAIESQRDIAKIRVLSGIDKKKRVKQFIENKRLLKSPNRINP